MARWPKRHFGCVFPQIQFFFVGISESIWSYESVLADIPLNVFAKNQDWYIWRKEKYYSGELGKTCMHGFLSTSRVQYWRSKIHSVLQICTNYVQAVCLRREYYLGWFQHNIPGNMWYLGGEFWRCTWCQKFFSCHIISRYVLLRTTSKRIA